MTSVTAMNKRLTIRRKMNFVLSYSFGKDSTLSLHRMLQQKNNPVALIVMVNEEMERSFFHGVDYSLMKEISDCLEIPILFGRSSGGDYDIVMEDTLRKAKELGAEVAVFGDIDISDHKTWCDERCKNAEIVSEFPLWHNDRSEILDELIQNGYSCVIKTINNEKLGRELLGRAIDREIIKEFKKREIDICGENGEYHTIVLDGPVFKRKPKYGVGERLEFGVISVIDIFFEEKDAEEYYFESFDGMERLAPGSSETTVEAISDIDRKEEIKILDIGCGVGQHTMLMAQEIKNAKIIAIDNHSEYVDILNEKAKKKGIDDRLNAQCMSMFEMTFEEGSFDYIYAEGSIYIAGFENGLADWKKYLKDDGLLICSEISWITENPSKKAKKYWDEYYAQMEGITQNCEKATRQGYEVVRYFVLNRECWWDNYYQPLKKNIDEMLQKYKGETVQGVVKELQEEIDMYNEHGDEYSYVFYIMRKKAGDNGNAERISDKK